MSDRFRVSHQLGRRLEELGICAATAVRAAGLPVDFLEREPAFVSTSQMFALWQAIESASDRPGIGLAIGSEERMERYDPICIAALYAGSLRDALMRLTRFKQIACPEEVTLADRPDGCALRFRWTLAQCEEPPQLIDYCFAWVKTLAQRGTGQDFAPLRVELKRASSDRALYEEFFGCPVVFNAPQNEIVFRRGDLERPFLTHNPVLLRMLAPQLEEELQAHLAERTLEGRVKATIKRMLTAQRPDIRSVGRDLGMSARTLQRRLAESGATFQRMLEEARREMARHYLTHSSLELNETAYLLGYEDSNSFFRAFSRWEGQPPGQWRAERKRTLSPAPRA